MSKREREQDPDDPITIRFTDRVYTIPLHIAQKIDRIALLLKDNPDWTECFFQEIDQGRFESVINPLVASVDPGGFSTTLVETDQIILIHTCKFLVSHLVKTHHTNFTISLPLIPTRTRTPYYLALIPSTTEFSTDKVLLAEIDWVDTFKNTCRSVEFVFPKDDEMFNAGFGRSQDFFISCELAVIDDKRVFFHAIYRTV